MRIRFIFLLILLAGVAAFGVARAQVPSGERELAQSLIEPGYDARSGEFVFIKTPFGPPDPPPANEHALSPLFIIVYPNSAAADVGTMSCAHEGGDNCPDHGPAIAGIAQAAMPAVYGAGVWGHDHMVDGHGGRDFNVGWHVLVVLFTNADAARTHIVTKAQLDAVLDDGDAIIVDTPIVIHGNLVSQTTYDRATPVPF